MAFIWGPAGLLGGYGVVVVVVPTAAATAGTTADHISYRTAQERAHQPHANLAMCDVQGVLGSDCMENPFQPQWCG